jgi:hypothetical protein
MAAGSLRIAAPEGDGRCAECERAPAVGPCAACESMICGDCGVMSRDPEGVKVICLSCARLIAAVRERKPARPGTGARLVAVALLIASGLGALSLLAGCGHGHEPTQRSAAGRASARSASADSPAGNTAPADATPGPRLPRPPPLPGTAWLREITPPAGTGEIAGGVVAARVFAFADSQLHYLLGKRTFAQSPFAERMSFEVAVRPAALDDGSDLLLALFLDEYQRVYAGHTPVFLGDAADLSCVQEIEAFFDVLADAGLDRLMTVTSNHDGFFAGNFTSRRDLDGQLAITDMPHDWTRACALPGRFDDHRLTKGRAVQRLAARLPAGPVWATHVSPGAGGAPGGPGAGRGDGPGAFREAFLAYVRPLGGGDPGAPPVWGIFLDTVDYRGFDLEESLGAGTTGALSAEQMRFLDRAVEEVRRAAGAAPLTLVVFGHHPVASLEPASRTRLRRFLAAHSEIAAYVTAHEHAPTERRIDLGLGLGLGPGPGKAPGQRRIVPELVIGSTTDAPQSAGLLAVQIDPRTGQRSVSRRRLVLDAAAACADVPPLPRDALGYTAYRIARDGIPELDLGALDQILFAIGLDDLAAARTEQGLGALLVENELVRSWARLYAGAPLARPAADQHVLDRVLGQRYAAGGNLAAVWPFLRGQAPRAPATDSWYAWHDPVTAPVLAAAEQAVHRFGAHADTIARLRSLRTRTPEAHRYFLCHAAHAAQAEARTPRRKGHVLYIQ